MATATDNPDRLKSHQRAARSELQVILMKILGYAEIYEIPPLERMAYRALGCIEQIEDGRIRSMDEVRKTFGTMASSKMDS